MLIASSALAVLSLAALLWRIWRHPAGKTRGDILRGAAAGAGLFLALWPPVGAVVFTLGVTIAGHDLQGLKNLPMMIFLMPFSYFVGGAPALLCGVVAGAFWPVRVSRRSYCWAGLLGGLYGTAFQLGIASRDFAGLDISALLLMGGLPGLVSAVACARILYGKPAAAAAQMQAPA